MSTTFVLIGGNEDIYPGEPVFKAIENELEKESRIRIFPTASSYPESTSETYCHQFESMGFEDVSVVQVLSREDSGKTTFIEEVRDADAIFFIGGDQSRLIERVRGTRLHDALLERLGDDIVISGTSAGAMALCGVMIAGGGAGNALRKGEIPLKQGLGMLPNIVLDTHFIARNRFYRLVHSLALHPDKIGIGITNDSAVVLKDSTAAVVGTDVVTILQGKNVSFNTSDIVNDSERIGAGPFEMIVVPFGFKVDLNTFRISKASLSYPATHR